MWTRYIKHQTGFTLVELAIVLVIIGLLLGGVLKGQEMIENGKIKNLKNDLQGVTAAYYAYRDRYNALPGDDSNADNRWTAATAPVATGGNGDGNGTDGGNSVTNSGVAGGGFGAIGTAPGGAGIGCSGFLGAPGLAASGENGGNGGAGQSCCCFSFGSIPGGGGGGGGQLGGGGGGGAPAEPACPVMIKELWRCRWYLIHWWCNIRCGYNQYSIRQWSGYIEL
jgi:prepilin-type N-terminal cleavage/methylation domain-containing protein